MQRRFDEFNNERRHLTRSQPLHELFALPVDEEELHHYGCTYNELPGLFVITPTHFAFLAHDQSAMFSLPISELTAMAQPPCATGAGVSLRLTMSNGKVVISTTKYE